MERDILFRGKRISDGAWVEGYYVHIPCGRFDKNENLIQTISKNGRIGILEQVYPDTVGQYTGLTDKNGVKIFEEDIIKTKKFGKSVGHTNVNDFDFFVVTYENQMFRLLNKNRGFNLIDDGYSKFEIIGNIHDSPEIMKGNKDE